MANPLHGIPDDDLASRIQSGIDVALAFEELFARYERRLFYFFLVRTRNADAAGDLVSEVFLKLHCWQFKSYVPQGTLAAYLFSIAARALTDYRRKQAKTEPLPPHIDPVGPVRDPAAQAEGAEELLRLHEAVAQLRPEDQRLVQLKYNDGLTAEEIAEREQTTADAIEMRLHRARERLRRALGAPKLPTKRGRKRKQPARDQG